MPVKLRSKLDIETDPSVIRIKPLFYFVAICILCTLKETVLQESSVFSTYSPIITYICSSSMLFPYSVIRFFPHFLPNIRTEPRQAPT